MRLEDIPGYEDALAWEAEARELAFLDLPRDLCGVEVLPLTLRRERALICAGSVFFKGGTPTDGDVAAFLWALSPEYSRDPEARASWLARFALRDEPDTGDDVRAISDFLDQAFNDAPAPGEPARAGVAEPAYTSFEAGIVDLVCSQYGWPEAAVLDCPLERLFQYLRRIAKRLDPKASFNSRRALRVKGDWLRSLQASAPEAEEHSMQE